MSTTHPLYSQIPIPVVVPTGARGPRSHRARRSPTLVRRVRAAALLTMTGAAAATLFSITIDPSSPPAPDRAQPHSAQPEPVPDVVQVDAGQGTW
ncbi:hypothetical protein [Streptomyces sp. NBC_00859]|uniref:hypothetical protein n=1 Tax=Streptomyces sp. NBC_00859 TaxID=2903682 RepID=UPI003870C89F|nr:hypothetical protein OG584_31560 [Streptomyces sp. NBC_00859]